jgi:hypothetical protein
MANRLRDGVLRVRLRGSAPVRSAPYASLPTSASHPSCSLCCPMPCLADRQRRFPSTRRSTFVARAGSSCCWRLGCCCVSCTTHPPWPSHWPEEHQTCCFVPSRFPLSCSSIFSSLCSFPLCNLACHLHLEWSRRVVSRTQYRGVRLLVSVAPMGHLHRLTWRRSQSCLSAMDLLAFLGKKSFLTSLILCRVPDLRPLPSANP